MKTTPPVIQASPVARLCQGASESSLIARTIKQSMGVILCMANLLGVTRLAVAADPEVTIEFLLCEMTDRDAPARWPAPAYTCKQASSWDRTQTGPDNPATWFNNNDFDQSIRIEEKAGRKEYVIMQPGTTVKSFTMADYKASAAEVKHAVGTFWYAKPGATSNRGPAAEEASAELPTWPPAPPSAFRDAIEFESMKVLAATPALPMDRQVLAGVLPGEWSGGAHLFVRAAKPGDFVEFVVAEGIDGPRRITLHATKSFDYGTIQFSVNGKAVSKPFDGFNGQPQPSGAIDLGVCVPAEGRLVLRAEVVGSNPASKGHFFGLDCAVLSPVTGQ